MATIDDLKSNLDWAMMYQAVLEKFATSNVASYSTGGNTFTRNNIKFYSEQYEKYAALARRDEAGTGGVSYADFRD